jgi:flagellar biosynthesis/type III secretory pathway M-ring protein FliF/YscJ
VQAIAGYIASAKAGLDPKQVTISDGLRSYTVAGEEDFQASTYLEHAAKCEDAVRNKIASHLSYIGGVSIAVTAIVDVRKTLSKTKTVKPKGSGSEALISKDSSTTSNQTQAGQGAEPGLGSNVALDINRGGGGGGTNVNDEKGETEYMTNFGTEEVEMTDPRGMPTKINAAIGVPREYVVMLVQQKAGAPAAGAAATAPTQKEIDDAFAAEKARIESDIAPLIETDAKGAADTTKLGTVVVSMIPVPVTGAGAGPAGPGASGTSAGGFGGIGTLAQSGLLKQAVLGGLAVVALAMMLLMVRKASSPGALPTAEELVGIPPALAAGSDLIGEADEGDTAMVGIEIDDASLKTKKMLEEVDDMVTKSPADAGAIFTRWMATEA